MREVNNTKIIAIDHGYGNIKTANTVTPTGIMTRNHESVPPMAEDTEPEPEPDIDWGFLGE
ncbi:MAG: hypothetical protein LUG54_07380 [Clostridiales bacterium]|nr:hypothetical protein [Clostridiales bacterium]